MNYLRAELLDHLAAAYVLGTLRGPARRRFERLCRSSAAVRMAVQDWETKLMPLAASVPEVTPTAKLWARIAGQLGHAEAASKSVSWRRFLAPAVSFAFGLVMAIGVLQFSPGLLPQKEAPPVKVSPNTGLPPSYVGLLLDREGRPAILASSLRHGKTVSIKLLQQVTIPAGKTAAVWALAPDTSPVLLGALKGEERRFDMSGTSEELLSKTEQLAVSIQEATVTPVPDNFVFVGHCVKLW
jgi:anti-sigma-K factor RskA